MSGRVAECETGLEKTAGRGRRKSPQYSSRPANEASGQILQELVCVRFQRRCDKKEGRELNKRGHLDRHEVASTVGGHAHGVSTAAATMVAARMKHTSAVHACDVHLHCRPSDPLVHGKSLMERIHSQSATDSRGFMPLYDPICNLRRFRPKWCASPNQVDAR